MVGGVGGGGVDDPPPHPMSIPETKTNAAQTLMLDRMEATPYLWRSIESRRLRAELNHRCLN
jgi:hypothetical protein